MAKTRVSLTGLVLSMPSTSTTRKVTLYMLSLARDFCIKLEGTGFQQSFLVCKVGHKVAEWTRPWIESTCEKKPLRLKEALVVIPSRDDMRDNDDFSTILEAYKYKCPFDPQRKRFSRWWFQIFFGIFTPILREMIQFDEHIFQMVETTNQFWCQSQAIQGGQRQLSGLGYANQRS